MYILRILLEIHGTSRDGTIHVLIPMKGSQVVRSASKESLSYSAAFPFAFDEREISLLNLNAQY